MAPTVATNITYTIGNAPGHVQASFDWNGNGSFADPGEQVLTGATLQAREPVAITPPLGAVLGNTYARFRVSTASLSYGALAADGEVEDYLISINEPPVASFNGSPFVTQEGGTVTLSATATSASGSLQSIQFDLSGTTFAVGDIIVTVPVSGTTATATTPFVVAATQTRSDFPGDWRPGY